MQSIDSDKLPQSGESLAEYLRRLRMELGLTQKEVASKAGIHLQSLGKLERGISSRLNSKSKKGLALALQVPSEYFEALVKGKDIVDVAAGLKFCPVCWQPGTLPDSLWMHERAKFCFACGTQLRNRCSSCNEPISSLKHRFCPYCGTSYKKQ
ncbi:MAG: zinc ribbon domain-containing protein [Cyanobacteria bacterium P01_E01_bin.45]